MQPEHGLDSPSKYYNAYFTLDILLIFAYHMPSALFDTYKFPINA